MIRFPDSGRIHLDEGLMGFADTLAQQRIVQTRLDLLLIGAAHAIRQKIPPLEKINRHELIRVGGLDDDRRLLFEALLPSYASELGLAAPENGKELLDLLERAGSAGFSILKIEWDQLSSGQIRMRLLGLPE